MNESERLKALESCSWCGCGCCKDGCPMFAAMPGEHVSARGRNAIVLAYLQGRLQPDEDMARALYSCLLCRLDEESCLARIPNAEIYESVRRELVEKGIGPLPEHRPLLASLRNYGNPWMQPRSARARWAKRAGIQMRRSPTLFFAGCTFSLSPDVEEVPIAAAELMRIAGVEFSALGKDELCCGSTALRLGDTGLFKTLSKENAKTLTGCERVVTSCAGCFKTMSQDYELGENGPKVVHFTQLLSELLDSGKLKPREMKIKVTYHDPCHLGRHSKVYDAPRRVIGSIPGVELVEMRHSKEHARCCGAGAGVKTSNPQISLEIAKRRIEEAEETGAEILISSCPFCEQSLKEAVQAVGGKMKVMDVAELLLMACK